MQLSKRNYLINIPTTVTGHTHAAFVLKIQYSRMYLAGHTLVSLRTGNVSWLAVMLAGEDNINK